MDDDGNLVWQNGKKPATRTEALAQILEHLKRNLSAWDHQQINILYHILADIEIIIAPERLREVIDLSTLPSEPIPEGMKGYPIWAVDKAGFCLVGAGQITIEPLADIRDWFVTRKPGYCIRAKEKACYLCNLTKNAKDCRNNKVFFPK